MCTVYVIYADDRKISLITQYKVSPLKLKHLHFVAFTSNPLPLTFFYGEFHFLCMPVIVWATFLRLFFSPEWHITWIWYGSCHIPMCGVICIGLISSPNSISFRFPILQVKIYLIASEIQRIMLSMNYLFQKSIRRAYVSTKSDFRNDFASIQMKSCLAFFADFLMELEAIYITKCMILHTFTASHTIHFLFAFVLKQSSNAQCLQIYICQRFWSLP